MYDQLSHPDCDSRTSSQGEDLYLQEADPLPELDRSAHQRCNSAQDQLVSFSQQPNGCRCVVPRKLILYAFFLFCIEFNVGQYRRDYVKIYKSFEFFSPDNEEGLKIRR